MTASLSLSATDRFALIMRLLREAVAARIRFPPVTGAIIVYIWARLRRIETEFLTLAAKIHAGTYVARWGGRRCLARRTSRSSTSMVQRHYEMGLPPWAPGWLHRIAPGDAGCAASGLRMLCADPEMMALIAATPQIARILRPLFWMLKLEANLLAPPAPVASVAAVAGAGLEGAAMDVAAVTDAKRSDFATESAVATSAAPRQDAPARFAEIPESAAFSQA